MISSLFPTIRDLANYDVFVHFSLVALILFLTIKSIVVEFTSTIFGLR
jgi:hypothetical protein